MAVKVVHVSDISGQEADEQTLGRLVIHEHPEYADLPVTLEVLPKEVESLQGASRFVTVEWIAPAAQRRRAAGGPAAARSTTPPWSTPASPTAAASPRPRRSWCATTSTWSTGACGTRACARSTRPTPPCATATAFRVP